MESPAATRPSGFTLIELLVSLSLITLLVAVLLPALTQARDAARGVGCASNLAQLSRGWEVLMHERKGVIPRTNPLTFFYAGPAPPRWDALLRDSLDTAAIGAGSGLAPRPGATVCPSREHRFNGPTNVEDKIGYAVNVRRVAGQERWLHEGTSWFTLRRPSAYPWLADPYINASGAPYMERNGFAVTAAEPWNLGFYHPRDTAQVGFADGHVAAVVLEDLAGPTDSLGVPHWFLDAR